MRLRAVTFLDGEFLERWVEEFPVRLGEVTGTVVLKTSGGPEGKASATLAFSKGALVAAEAGAKRDADLTLEAPWQLAADSVGGQADPAAAYMAGDLKVSGDMAMWLELLREWHAAGSLAPTG